MNILDAPIASTDPDTHLYQYPLDLLPDSLTSGGALRAPLELGDSDNKNQKRNGPKSHFVSEYSNFLPLPDSLTSGGAPRAPLGSGDSDTNFYLRNGPISPSVFKNPGSSNYIQGYNSNDPASYLVQNSLPLVPDLLTPGGALKAPPGLANSDVKSYHYNGPINPFGYKNLGSPGHSTPPPWPTESPRSTPQKILLIMITHSPEHPWVAKMPPQTPIIIKLLLLILRTKTVA